MIEITLRIWRCSIHAMRLATQNPPYLVRRRKLVGGISKILPDFSHFLALPVLLALVSSGCHLAYGCAHQRRSHPYKPSCLPCGGEPAVLVTVMLSYRCPRWPARLIFFRRFTTCLQTLARSLEHLSHVTRAEPADTAVPRKLRGKISANFDTNNRWVSRAAGPQQTRRTCCSDRQVLHATSRVA